ncbi:MAG: cyclic peptide export ABC transporter [Pyrinomonadaceae bacterium]
MKLISFLFKHSRGAVIIAALISIISGGSSALLIVLINNIFIRPAPTTSHTVWYFIGLVALVLVSNLISEALLNHLSEQALFSLRMRLCKKILAAPLRQLEEIGAPKLVGTLTEDVPNLSRALLSVPVVCINLALLIGCLVYLGWLSVAMLLPLIIFLILAVVSVEALEWKGKKYLKLAREEWNVLLKHFHALTEGNKELKLHRQRRGAFVSESLEPTAEVFRKYSLIGRNVYTAANSWTQSLYFIVIGLLLFTYSRSISKEVLIAYTMTFLFMRIPIMMLLSIMPTYSRASISLRKVEDLGLSLKDYEHAEETTTEPDVPTWQHLDLLDVTHTYYQEHEDRQFTLGPINLSFQPGELVLVVGGNGSGKTTFAKLLTGLYVPEGGEIQMNGERVTDENRDRYRQNFSVIFSEFYLFERLLGLDTGNLDGMAREYISKLQLEHKVSVENGQLSTIELSRGQRKRLALLTSYLEDRPIYVFDEWAADQDPMFKELFYLQLLPELKARGKTVLVISHDDRYYHIADRVIKMDYGKIKYDQRKPEEDLAYTY